jgi:hypothetical protein
MSGHASQRGSLGGRRVLACYPLLHSIMNIRKFTQTNPSVFSTFSCTHCYLGALGAPWDSRPQYNAKGNNSLGTYLELTHMRRPDEICHGVLRSPASSGVLNSISKPTQVHMLDYTRESKSSTTSRPRQSGLAVAIRSGTVHVNLETIVFLTIGHLCNG